MSSISSILSIQEMIDAAFGEADKNVVNFKLIHSILYILARQLRLLQRRVEVEIDPLTAPVSSTLLVTEVKLRANVPKKRRRKIIKTEGAQLKRDIGAKKSLLDKATLDKPRISSVKSETDKSSEVTTSKSSEKTSSKSTTDKTTTSSLFKTSTSLSSSTTKTTTEKSTTDKSSTEKSTTDKSSTDKSTTDKSSTEKSTTDKSSTDKSTTDKSSTDKSTTDKSSTEKSTTDKSSTDKSTTDKSSTEKSTTDKSSTEKSTTDKSSTDKSTTDKSSTEKSTTDKSSTEKSTSDKSSTEKSTTDKSSTEKSSTDKTSSLQSSTDKSSSDRTKSSTDKSSSDKTKSSTDKSSSDRTKSSTDKSSSDKTKSSTDKSSSDMTKTSAEKSSSDRTKSSTDKSSSDRTKSSTDKSSSDRTKSSTEKSSSDKTKSSTEKSSSDMTKSSTDKSSSDKTKSSTDKSSSDKTKSSTDKSSSDRTKSSSDRTSTKESSDKTSSEVYGKKLYSKDYHRLLERIEQEREQELRVVNQRADSREEAKKIPTPMASLDEMEVQYERLLIVQRVPTDTDTRERTGRSRDIKEQPLSVVTQDQFDSLAELVTELQEKFGTIGEAEFPENIQLMQDLRRGASLTDAMAALQLSARIEAAEKTLGQMMSLVTDLAVRKGIDIATTPERDSEAPETEVLFGAPGPSSQVPPKISQKSTAFKQPRAPRQKTTIATTAYEQSESISLVASGEALQHIDANFENIQGVEIEEIVDTDGPKVNPDWITTEELDEAMKLMYDSLFKTISAGTSKASSSADSALKIANRLEKKIDDALNLETRMDDLETLVSEYAGQINTLDSGLSSYMTDYQEQLTQMQHDLEGGLESMAEAMANTGGDTAAVAELNNNITNLQIEFDSTNVKQKTLQDQQNLLFTDLESLWKQIEILRATKSDREEAADALRDKAGLGALNGLVSQEQFDAVRGDFEKRIGAAYDKFNNQEIIWQKAIDDLLRELYEKADWLQVSSLRNDVNDNLDKLRYKIKEIMDIVGEPRSAAVSKKLFHDTSCLSCSSPAHMNLEEPGLLPALPGFSTPGKRQATIGAGDKSRPKEDGDHGLCYPGHPIPHPKDPRSHVCHRYCGGSHTIITGAVSRAPVGMIISPALKPVRTEIGSDGRVYMTDEPEMQSKPCLPCNFTKAASSQPSDSEKASNIKSPSPSIDFLVPNRPMTKAQQDSISETPPPPLDD